MMIQQQLARGSVACMASEMFMRYLVFVVLLGLHHSCGHMPTSDPHYVEGSGLPKTRVRRLSGVPKPVWHVGVYHKNYAPFKNICGGTVVRNDVVISAAHCFVSFGNPAVDPSKYAVAGNKNYRLWDDENDPDAQKSDVKEIIVHPVYHGVEGKFQFDIAVIRLATPFRYTRGLRPVCVDFDEEFEATQLRDGNRGTLAGWGLTGEDGGLSRRLLWWEPPYVSLERCFASVDKSFYPYITADKFCAGENSTGKAACKGDSGGALVFWRGRTANAVPFLRGIVSIAPSNDDLCNIFTVAVYTRVSASKRFLLQTVPGLDRDCQFKLTKSQVRESGQPLR